jgi:hypothetical protein
MVKLNPQPAMQIFFPTVERFTTKVALNSREPLANCIGPRGTNLAKGGRLAGEINLRGRAGRASNVMAEKKVMIEFHSM